MKATRKPKPGCVSVDEITESGLDWTMQLPDDFVDALLPVDFVRTAEPVMLRVRMALVESSVVANGTVSGKLKVICCRCLAERDFEFRKSFRHVFVEGKDPAADKAEEVISETDDLSCTFFAGDEVDLLTLSGDEMVLALPVKPVCRPDCRGLCPICGNDRNVTPCKCGDDVVDSRWAGLKSLKLDPNP